MAAAIASTYSAFCIITLPPLLAVCKPSYKTQNGMKIVAVQHIKIFLNFFFTFCVSMLLCPFSKKVFPEWIFSVKDFFLLRR